MVIIINHRQQNGNAIIFLITLNKYIYLRLIRKKSIHFPVLKIAVLNVETIINLIFWINKKHIFHVGSFNISLVLLFKIRK